MKESEFIELLNLYLDHEITAEDAGRLEAEVLRSPGRRKIYRQYCRMQKACRLTAEDFCAASPAAGPAAALLQARRFRRWTAGLYASGVAAAACVAALVLVRSRPAPVPTAGVVRAAPAVPPAASPPLSDDHLELVMAARGPAAADAPFAFDGGQDDPLAWLNGVRLAPIPPIDIAAPEAKPSFLQEDRALAGSSKNQPAGNAEMSAFQFQR